MSFEMGPTSSGSAVWESRVREAARQISAAAKKPEPTIRYVIVLLYHFAFGNHHRRKLTLFGIFDRREKF